MNPYYESDGITVYQGNCLEVMPSLPAESVDLVLTDPPYLVDYRGRWDNANTGIVGDDNPDWIKPAFAEIWRLLKPDTFCISFYGWPHADIFLGIWKSLGFRPVSHFAFVKRQIGLGRFTRSGHETAFLLAKGHPAKVEPAISDVIDWKRESEKFHPNQKPVASLIPLLLSYCPEKGTVLDPFLGSGSTLRASKDTARFGIGIEIEPDYCRKAVSRLTQGVLEFSEPLSE